MRRMLGAILAMPGLFGLMRSEVNLRTAARRFEMDPRYHEEAAELFGRADRVRAERIRRLQRCGLL